MTVLFDTSTLTPRDRAESWLEAHHQIFFPVGVRFACDDASSGTIRGARLGSLSAYRVTSDPSVVRRTGDGVRAFDPEQFLVALPLGGRMRIDQSGRASAFTTGDLSCWDSSRPFRVLHPQAFDLLLFVVPRALLGARADAMYRRTAVRIDGDSASAALASRFLRHLWITIERQPSAGGREDLADAVLALIRSLYEPDADGRRLPGDALLTEIKGYVEHNLADPRLCPEMIAEANAVSKRYVHLLFSRSGTTVSGWVRQRRLEHCRRDLRDPALAHEPIAAIAARWGLTNPAHFTRIFRAAYGVPPGEYRSQ